MKFKTISGAALLKRKADLTLVIATPVNNNIKNHKLPRPEVKYDGLPNFVCEILS